MTHTNTVTPKELCQLVRDAHSRISASIIKTRWSLIFQQCELEILAISNWITSITIRARTQEFLVFFILYFQQSLMAPIHEVKTSQGCGFSSNVIYSPLHSLLEDGTGKSLFTLNSFYSVSNSATRDQYWTSFRSSGQAASSCEGLTASCPKWHRGRWGRGHTFISNLVVFIFVKVVHSSPK